MNISLNKELLLSSLSCLEDEFRVPLVDTYIELKKRHIKSFYNDEFDAVGLSSGKFCEIVFRILEKAITGKFTPLASAISNFPDKALKLAQNPAKDGDESLRVVIPRALTFIYTLRNKRGIGHIGGDIEANAIDISTIIKTVDWVLCELIRLYNNLPMGEAQQIINSLNIKVLPDIWHIDDNKRIIKDGLTHKQKVLFLLYNELDNKASAQELFQWTEYSNISLFKSRVLIPVHNEKLIEYNRNSGIVTISPTGIAYIEKVLIS